MAFFLKATSFASASSSSCRQHCYLDGKCLFLFGAIVCTDLSLRNVWKGGVFSNFSRENIELAKCLHSSKRVLSSTQLSSVHSVCSFITLAFFPWIVLVLLHHLESSLCFPLRPMVNIIPFPLLFSFPFLVIMLVLFALLVLQQLERCYLTQCVAKSYLCVGRHVGLSARCDSHPCSCCGATIFRS